MLRRGEPFRQLDPIGTPQRMGCPRTSVSHRRCGVQRTRPCGQRRWHAARGSSRSPDVERCSILPGKEGIACYIRLTGEWSLCKSRRAAALPHLVGTDLIKAVSPRHGSQHQPQSSVLTSILTRSGDLEPDPKGWNSRLGWVIQGWQRSVQDRHVDRRAAKDVPAPWWWLPERHDGRGMVRAWAFDPRCDSRWSHAQD